MIQEAIEKVSRGESEVTVDFSSVSRIDSKDVAALEELAAQADARSVKVTLRAVNMDIYLVLKQLALTRCFTFSVA